MVRETNQPGNNSMDIRNCKTRLELLLVNTSSSYSNENGDYDDPSDESGNENENAISDGRIVF